MSKDLYVLFIIKIFDWYSGIYFIVVEIFLFIYFFRKGVYSLNIILVMFFWYGNVL